MKPSELFQLKLPTPSGMSSAEWAEISPQIRDQAFFSARVDQQRIVDMLHDKLTQLIRNELDPSEFRRDMRSFLDSIGYSPDEGDVGTIKDLRTQARLELIRKINVDMARGYKQWRQFTTPAALEEFPAQRLVRRQRRNVQRDWLTRWQVAAQAVGWEGVYRGDDMVALKSSPIWVQLSRFGHPYPPFDFNSGMGTENVSIDECVKMGLVKEGEKLKPVPEATLSPEEGTMKISEFQEYLKDRLNKVEDLVNGNCKAFAEDTRTVYDESAQFIREGGVAVVVITPDLNRAGSGTKPGVIPFEGDIVIRCMELPPVAASDPNTVRALDAAETVMHELDGEIFEWRSTRQSASRDSDGNDVITATVTFGYTGELTK